MSLKLRLVAGVLEPRDQLASAGLAGVDLELGIDELSRHSIYSIPNDSVRELAGHPAHNIEDFLRRHQAVITPR